MTNFQLVRKLGFIETQMALFHSHKAGTTQGLRVITLEGNALLERLPEALGFLHRNYQALRCRIRETDDGLFFEDGVSLQDLELEVSHLRSSPERDLDEHLTRLINRPLDATRALWSIHAVRDGERCHLVLKFHHSIIDGDGLSRIANVLLAFLDGAEVNSGVHEPLASPVDDALRALPQKAAISGSVAPYERVAPIAQRTTRFVNLQVEPRHNEALGRLAAHHRLSPNSFLAALLAMAFGRVVPLPDPREVKSAVSLREGLVPLSTPNALACYIGVASASVAIEGRTLPEVAAEYQQRLYQDVLYSALRRSLVPFQPFRQYIQTIDDAGRFPHGIGLTNLGRIALPQLRQLRVTDYATFNNRNAGNVAVVLNALELFGGLRLNFVFCEPLVAGSTIQRVVDAFAESVGALAG